MNKSLVTHLISLLLIAASFSGCASCSSALLHTGLFALSGSLTNWLAIHMLFEKIPFLYGSGIITLRFAAIKKEIRHLILHQFFNEEHLQKFIAQMSSSSAKTSPLNLDKDLVFRKFKEAIMESSFAPMLALAGGEKVIDGLKPHIDGKIDEILQEATSQLSGTPLIDTAQIAALLDLRLEELTPAMIKDIMKQLIKEHLGWLVVWGGIFGGIIGLVSSIVL